MTEKQKTKNKKGKTPQRFDQDENASLGVGPFIQVIGEAARRVSPSFSRKGFSIPAWKIIGMRHKMGMTS